MKPTVFLRSFACLALASAALLAGCKRQPTAAEIEEARRAQEPPATPQPTPAPGAWMHDKNRKSTLDQPAKK